MELEQLVYFFFAIQTPLLEEVRQVFQYEQLVPLFGWRPQR
jgi:hypothetical protein